MYLPDLKRMLIQLELVALYVLLSSAGVEAHGGHSNEFAGQGEQDSSNVQIDRDTAQRIGIRVTAAKKQRLNIEITATGQIELLPNKQVEVTAPIRGKLVRLLVQPGAKVRASQVLAIFSSPELSDLRVAGLEKRSEAVASLQQARTDLQLAQQSYGKMLAIAQAEVSQAQSQLVSARSRLAREQQLVQNGSIVRAAENTYQHQQQIATAEIQAAQTELQLAQERYQKDVELADSGVLPRRQVLESKAKLATARTQLVKAQSKPDVLQAATELRKAETDLPLRELREAEKQLAELQGQLAKARNQKAVVEAEAQVQRSRSAVIAAQNRLQLSDDSYQKRLGQLGAVANAQGLIPIKSSIDGTVSDREITIGQSVADPGAKLMTIVDDRQVLATANVYESDLQSVRIGQPATVRVAGAGDRSFTGQISRIGTAIDGQSRVVPVQAVLENSAGLLKAGMFAEIKLATDRQTAVAIVIPTSAVVDANQEKLVYVQSGAGYLPVTVSLGRTVGDLVEVKTGLFAGDLVVSQRAPQLYAQSLKIKPADAHGETAQQNPSPIPNYLWWGIVPTAGLLGGGAVWLHRRKNRVPASLVEPIDPEETFERDRIEPAESSITDPPLLSAASDRSNTNSAPCSPR